MLDEVTTPRTILPNLDCSYKVRLGRQPTAKDFTGKLIFVSLPSRAAICESFLLIGEINLHDSSVKMVSVNVNWSRMSLVMAAVTAVG